MLPEHNFGYLFKAVHLINPAHQTLYVRKMKYIIYTFLFATAFCIISCKSKTHVVTPAFYFWKSNVYEFTPAERKYIDSLHVQKLYIKFFEVAPDPVWGNAPISKTNLRLGKWDSLTSEVIPVIFIKNEVFHHSSKQALDSLAENIVFLINKTNKEKIHYPSGEIQIDCDWTASTKEKYFYFLSSLKKISRKIISVTLRLYPYKYPEKMGVPPADKATLMCYNLVNALDNENKNSILDINELKKYVDGNKKYPLHLDIALPAYSWMLVYQNKQFKGVISQQNESLVKQLTPINTLWYEVSRDTVIDEYYLRSGDRIKYENITPAVLKQAAEIIKSNIALDDSVTISVFHLDEQKLSNYSYEIFDNVYSTFSK